MNKVKRLCRVLNDLHDGFLLVVFAVAILVSGYGMYDVWYVYHHLNESSLYSFTPDSPSSELERLPITDEMTGWIYFEATGMNFSVMRGNHNLTLLNMDPSGHFPLSGSVFFLDSRNSPGFTDKYSLVYGHHMEYGKMFGALDAYLDRDFASKHRNGTLLIGRNGSLRRRLTVFAVLRTDAKELAAFDVEEPEKAVDFVFSHAQITFGTPGENILALSTCDAEDNSVRIIVACAIE